MRKVVSSLFMALDGVVESPDQWQFDLFSEDLMEDMVAQMSQEDAFLLGRVSYEEWFPFWPTSQDEPFASFINKTPKYVVSTTLDKVEWGAFDTVHLIRGLEEVRQLKQQPGQSIGVGGSATLVQSLLEHDLLDELRLMVHPVIAGKGKRLFKDGSAVKRLQLTREKKTSTGIMVLTYTVQR